MQCLRAWTDVEACFAVNAEFVVWVDFAILQVKGSDWADVKAVLAALRALFLVDPNASVEELFN